MTNYTSNVWKNRKNPTILTGTASTINEKIELAQQEFKRISKVCEKLKP